MLEVSAAGRASTWNGSVLCLLGHALNDRTRDLHKIISETLSPNMASSKGYQTRDYIPMLLRFPMFVSQLLGFGFLLEISLIAMNGFLE